MQFPFIIIPFLDLMYTTDSTEFSRHLGASLILQLDFSDFCGN
jgi:hypothetical protein